MPSASKNIAVPFDSVAIYVRADGSVGLSFAQAGREVFHSETKHLIPGDVLEMRGAVGVLTLETE